MEVGPLNSIPSNVQGPKEGKQGRIDTAASEKNRLTANGSKASKVSGDTADIQSRKTDLKNLQGKIAIGNTAKQAVMMIIDGLKAIETGENAAKAKAEIDKALKTEFSGQAVFNGKTLTHKTANGKSGELKVPNEDMATKLVVDSIKDAMKGKLKESDAFKELNKFYNKLNEFTDTAKSVVKRAVGYSNQGASRPRRADVNAVMETMQQSYNRSDNAARQNSTREMAGKTIKLLK